MFSTSTSETVSRPWGPSTCTVGLYSRAYHSGFINLNLLRVEGLGLINPGLEAKAYALGLRVYLIGFVALNPKPTTPVS